jgi:transcriptional regulator with XRE-family HTH domain
MSIMKSVPEILLSELDKRGWTQAELAKRSGVTSAQISRIISGQRGSETKTLVAIANALKISPDVFLRAAGLLPPAPEKDEWVEQASFKLSKLDPSRRSIADSFIDALLEEPAAPAPVRRPRTAGGKA